MRVVLCVYLALYASFASGRGGTCPSVCVCKWKGGKQTVECVDRVLISIPEGLDPETQVLDVSGNNLQILPRETFVRAGLLNLQRVYLRSCRIGQIDSRALKGLTNLVELDLSNNLLTAIPSATLLDTPFLRDMFMSHNPIQKIEGNAFKNVPGLVRLDLSNCELQTIAPRAFEHIDLLESLKINGNRLSELRPRIMETLTRLHGIELHDNPWICDCRLRAVKEWLTARNVPHPVPPICSGGPERVAHKTFAELHVDDFACRPEILPASRHVEAATGENATVTCRAGAVPAAELRWYWNGRPLHNGSTIGTSQRVMVLEDGHFEKRSRLVVIRAQQPDSGEFYCVAENRAGSAEANFTLHVSVRSAGISTLASGQLAGLSAALVALILLALLIVMILLLRLRRTPFVESKTPGQLEVVTVVNGATIANKSAATVSTSGIQTSSFCDRKAPAELSFSCTNPVQKPPRLAETTAAIVTPAPVNFLSPSSASGNNPDLINDTKRQNGDDADEVVGQDDRRPGSGEYSRACDSLYPSGLWTAEHTQPTYGYDDRTPIMGDGASAAGSEDEIGTRAISGYPPDYGLPIAAEPPPPAPVAAKTLRVWQRGGVPVLPPVSALKRALTSSRSSPDEGYQEGCGTDV